MSMTIAEAIKRIRNHMAVHRIGQPPHIHIGEALTMAIAALREKAEHEDPKPLTIEELRQMHGEPVWMAQTKRWAIIDVEDSGKYEGIPFACFEERSVSCTWNIEKRQIRCYRHKPKEDDHG